MKADEKPSITIDRETIGALFCWAGLNLLWVVPALIAYGCYGWLRYGQYTHVKINDVWADSVPHSDWVGMQKVFDGWANSDVIWTALVVAVVMAFVGLRLTGDR